MDDLAERRHALLTQGGKQRLDMIASRKSATRPPNDQLTSASSPPRRVPGASPVFSSSPPAGLLNLAIGSRSAPTLSHGSSGSVPPVTVMAAGSSAGASSSAGAWGKALVVRHRRSVALACSTVLGVWFGVLAAQESAARPCFVCYWGAVCAAVLTVAWLTESARLIRQLLSCKSLGMAALLALQHTPVLKGLVVDWIDAFCVYFVLFASTLMLLK